MIVSHLVRNPAALIADTERRQTKTNRRDAGEFSCPASGFGPVGHQTRYRIRLVDKELNPPGFQIIKKFFVARRKNHFARQRRGMAASSAASWTADNAGSSPRANGERPTKDAANMKAADHLIVPLLNRILSNSA